MNLEKTIKRLEKVADDNYRVTAKLKEAAATIGKKIVEEVTKTKEYYFWAHCYGGYDYYIRIACIQGLQIIKNHRDDVRLVCDWDEMIEDIDQANMNHDDMSTATLKKFIGLLQDGMIDKISDWIEKETQNLEKVAL